MYIYMRIPPPYTTRFIPRLSVSQRALKVLLLEIEKKSLLRGDDGIFSDLCVFPRTPYTPNEK